MIEQSVHVVNEHVDLDTPQIVAEEKGFYGTGHHRDLSEFSSATQCTAVWESEQPSAVHKPFVREQRR